MCYFTQKWNQIFTTSPTLSSKSLKKSANSASLGGQKVPPFQRELPFETFSDKTKTRTHSKHFLTIFLFFMFLITQKWNKKQQNYVIWQKVHNRISVNHSFFILLFLYLSFNNIFNNNCVIYLLSFKTILLQNENKK